jgi:hypothetical protein
LEWQALVSPLAEVQSQLYFLNVSGGFWGTGKIESRQSERRFRPFNHPRLLSG